MKTAAIRGSFAIILGAMAVVGCATTPPPPDAAIQAADIAITNADKEQASQFAPAELQSARDKVAAARAAIAHDPEENDVVRARRLADEAQADAELASARGRDGRAEAVNADLQKNIDILRQELQRKSGGAV